MCVFAAGGLQIRRADPANVTKRAKIFGGAREDRTPDLVIANDALSQLSYGPDWCSLIIHKKEIPSFWAGDFFGAPHPPPLGAPSPRSGEGKDDSYLMIFATTPAPTVRPPSRMAKRRPSSMATGLIKLTTIFTLSPGITISTPSGNSTAPVISVVRK